MADEKYQVTYMPFDRTINGKTYRCGKITGKKQIVDSRALAAKMKARGRGKSLEEAELAAQIDDMQLTIAELCYESYVVYTKYAIYQMKMKGQLGTNDTIGPKTSLEMSVHKREDMKMETGKCSFINEGSLANVRIESIVTVGGTKADEWVKNKNVIATGANLVFDSAIGDKVTATFTVEGEERTVDLTVKSSQYNSMELAWHEDLFYVTAGESVELTFTLHGGKADANPKTITKKVTIAA